MRVADRAAAVVDADRLGHAHADQAERRLAERDLLLGVEVQVEDQQPFALVEKLDVGAAAFEQQRLLRRFVDPGVDGVMTQEASPSSAIFSMR